MLFPAGQIGTHVRILIKCVINCEKIAPVSRDLKVLKMEEADLMFFTHESIEVKHYRKKRSCFYWQRMPLFALKNLLVPASFPPGILAPAMLRPATVLNHFFFPLDLH